MSSDPMEDFLSREKAALEALESVHITTSGASTSVDIVKPLSPPAPTTTSEAIPARVSPIISNGYASSNFTPTTSPIIGSPRLSISKREETAVMREWRADRNRRIAEHAAVTEQERQERRRQAQIDLESFKKSYERGVEEGRKGNRAAKANINSTTWDKEEPVISGTIVRKEDVDWSKVVELIEVLPKPAKDMSRLLNIIKSM